MGIFRRIENSQQLIKSIQYWQLKVDLEISVDSPEGLISAASITPDLIFLGTLIPPVEQVHLIPYLSKNKDTQHTSILVYKGFIKLHPEVICIDDKNTNGMRARCLEQLKGGPENSLTS